jgi:imidazolonepropionase-like amidohydrolase
MQAIVGGTLIDGRSGEPLADSTVLVGDDGRIASVGPRAATSLPEGTQQIDISGHIVMPGLIDCHDHLASFTYDLLSRWGMTEPHSTRTVRVARVIEDTLQSGYTTIRDCGWLDAGFKAAVEQGLVDGPRLLVAAGPLGPTHSVQDRPTFSGHRRYSMPDPNIPYGVADGADEIRAAVRENTRVGADLIKVFQTGFGRATHLGTDACYELEELRMLVAESHAQGRRVACHAVGGPGLRTAVEAGVDSIEHGCYLDLDTDLLRMMADKDITLVPTLTVFAFHSAEGNPVAQVEAREFREHHIETVQQAMRLGVRVTAGTDAGGWFHGNNAVELDMLTDAGMTPLESIIAGTREAAACCGLERDLGTLEAGKLADLIVVEGNPLDDITVLQDRERIKLVMKEGRSFRDLLGENS